MVKSFNFNGKSDLDLKQRKIFFSNPEEGSDGANLKNNESFTCSSCLICGLSKVTIQSNRSVSLSRSILTGDRNFDKATSHCLLMAASPTGGEFYKYIAIEIWHTCHLLPFTCKTLHKLSNITSRSAAPIVIFGDNDSMLHVIKSTTDADI